MKSIVRFFAKEHLLGNLLTILILLLGINSLVTIKRDIWPDVHFNITTVQAFLGGASPEQIEKLLVNPIESSLKEIDGLKKVFSTSTESQAIIVTQIDDKAKDPEKINSDLKRAIDSITEFPSEVERPLVTEVEVSQTPVIEVTIGGDEDPIKIQDTAKLIADELSSIPAVAKVTKVGYRKKEYLVSPDLKKLAKKQVSLSDLILSIKNRNISVPGGSAKIGNGMETLVRTEAQLSDTKELEESYIFANSAGYGTQIKDVAKVIESLAKPERLYHANGQRSLNLVVTKKKNGDALELVQLVREKVEKLKYKVSDKIQLGFSNDFTVYLKNRLGSLSSNLFIGLFLVAVVLIIFLPFQVTMVVAFGIPIALLSTIAVANFMGLSLNVISLIGLIIVLGMLVDDAIVVSENVWRHVEEKSDDIVEAVSEGTREVFGPVLASVLTTISAFAPMLFMTGIFGAFVYEIPLMVILALLFSLLEVFVIMPSHFTSWVGGAIKKSKIKEKKTDWFDAVIEKYQVYVKWSLQRRYKMLIGLATLFILTVVFVASSMKFVLFPGEGIETFFISAEAPVGTSLEKMERLIQPIEEEINKVPKGHLKDFVTSIGIIQQEPNDPQTRRGSNYAHIRIGLTAQSEREVTAEEIADKLREKVGIPKGLDKVSFEFARSGPPQGQPIAFSILGEDFDKLKEVGEKIKEEMAKIDGVIDIRDSFLPGKTEWQVRPNPSITAEVGLTASEVSQTVRASFEGIVASSIRNLDEETDIRVKLDQPEMAPLKQLERIQVGNRMGQLISLGAIAEFIPVTTMSSITHLEFKRAINISSQIDNKKTTAREATSKIKPIVEKVLNEYPGYGVEWGGEDQDTKESMESLMRAFLFAAFFIFCLLVITFRNLFQPVLILTSIPLGFMGVVYALVIHNRPLSFMAMLGIIALAGVIVNNSIVLIDFVNKKKKSGLPINKAIEDATKLRLRPIILTSVTTVIGLLPTAYGDILQKTFGIGGEDPFIVPIAIALGWGLALGTILVTIFFPALIHIMDDLESKIKRRFSN